MLHKSFHKGLESYKEGDYQEALGHFNEAVDEHEGQNLHQILDTRAAVHAKLGQYKEALKDSKRIIDIAPERWQGYARAARVFLQLNKVDPAQTMITMALERSMEPERRASLLSLQEEIQSLRSALEMRRKLFTDHISQLPIEVFGEIARILVEEDHTSLIPLLHVCKRWRTVIENSPQLWAKLVLTSRRPKPKAKLWIERTNGGVKELVVNTGASFSSNWPGNSLDGLQWDNLLVFHSQSWSFLPHLRFIGREAAVANWIDLSLEDITGFTPLLRSPFSLRSLSLKNTKMDLSGKICEYISGLRSLTLRNISGAWAKVLRANPLLERLELYSVTPSESMVFEGTLELDHLTTLDASCMVPVEIFTARMPHLCKLSLSLLYHKPDVFIQHLIDTLVGGLTELKLRGCSLDDSNKLLLLLRLSPNLQVLEFSNLTYGVASLLNALAAHYTPSELRFLPDDPPSDPPAILCPKLTHVNFSGCPEVQAGLLMRLIRSRLIGVQSPDTQIPSQIQATEISKIESLIIDCCPNVEKEWVGRMEELVSHVSCRYRVKPRKRMARGLFV